MAYGGNGKLTPPSKGLDEIDGLTSQCKGWTVQLLDIDGNPVKGKKYKITTPVNGSGTLNANGETSQYAPPLPADAKAIKILFDVKLLPKIESLFNNYPNERLYVDSVERREGVAFRVGGEYQDTYSGSYYEHKQMKKDFGQSPYYNTCVVRTSFAFNESAHEDAPYTFPRDPAGRGHGIPRGSLPSGNLERLGGSKLWPDKTHYAYATRVSEFERYMDHNYPDAPKLKGGSLGAFRGKDGVITFHNDHFDIIMNDAIRYNTEVLDGHHGPADAQGNRQLIQWKDGEIRLFQYVIIRPKQRTVSKGVCTFVFKMESR